MSLSPCTSVKTPGVSSLLLKPSLPAGAITLAIDPDDGDVDALLFRLSVGALSRLSSFAVTNRSTRPRATRTPRHVITAYPFATYSRQSYVPKPRYL